MNEIKSLNVTLVKSLIGTKKSHRRVVKGMGLKKINHTVCLPDSSAVRGMINKTAYLLRIEEQE